VGKTTLRILLDESITEPLAGRIMDLVPSAVHVRDCPQACGRPDDDIAAYALRERRLLVAVDEHFKTIRVKTGVIKLSKARNDDECLFAIFRAFWQSGHRGKCRARRTFLNHEGIRIVNGQALYYPWDQDPCSNHRLGR
jgi:hypothetical protein